MKDNYKTNSVGMVETFALTDVHAGEGTTGVDSISATTGKSGATIEHIDEEVEDSCFEQLGNYADRCYRRNHHRLVALRNIILLLLWFAYFGYALYYDFGDEPSIRLTVFTVFGTVYIAWSLLTGTTVRKRINRVGYLVKTRYNYGSRPKYIRWTLYIGWSVAMVTYIVINVALVEPRKLMSVVGIISFLLIMVLASNNKRKIRWHTVFWGMSLQLILGYLVIKWAFGADVVIWVSRRLMEFMSYSDVGAEFLFGPTFRVHRFAFKSVPSIIVFCTMINVLIYLGVIPLVIRTLGVCVAFILQVSAPEAMNASANIFLGGGECAFLIKRYLPVMPNSHLFSVLTSGMASVGGAALVFFISQGVPAEQLFSASVMSAPAALVCAKIIYPDTRTTVYDLGTNTPHTVADLPAERREHMEYGGDKSLNGDGLQRNIQHDEAKGIVHAMVKGSQQGMKLVTNLMGMILVFLAFLAFADKTVGWLGKRVGLQNISLKFLLSYVFYPLAFVMGVDAEDCLKIGELLGVRSVSTAGVAYITMGELVTNGDVFRRYTATYNDSSWFPVQDDIFLQHWNKTLSGGVISERSALVGTYALCGFASVSVMGLMLGAVSAVAPSRTLDASRLSVRSVVTGTIASYLTACVAGLLQ